MPIEKEVREFVLDNASDVERIRMLRTYALTELRNGPCGLEVGDGGWPGYMKALEELRNFIMREMPSTLYVDENDGISIEQPDNLIEDDEEIGGQVMNYRILDKSQIARMTFGALITDGGL